MSQKFENVKNVHNSNKINLKLQITNDDNSNYT